MTSRLTAWSSVAENSRHCRFGGVASRMRVTAGMKPRSAMWSASSSTAISTESRRTARRSIRSMRRPGVATRTCTPRRSCSICRPIDVPPTTTPMRRRSASAAGVSASATCCASSRVGTSTSPRGASETEPSALAARRVSIGRPKAERLAGAGLRAAEHVATARARRAGCSAWIAVGRSMPLRASTATTASGRPKPPNDSTCGSGALLGGLQRGVEPRCGRRMRVQRTELGRPGGGVAVDGTGGQSAMKSGMLR